MEIFEGHVIMIASTLAVSKYLFRMSKHDKAWNCRFQELLEYRHVFGNCSVPLRYRSNPSLGRWVNRQREAKNKQLLGWEREVMLNDVGFDWNHNSSSPSDAWQARFEELVRFKNEHMHCNVPQNFDKMKGLGGWVNRQRTARAKGTLVQERIDKLDSIDFSWNIKNDAWDIRFDQLIKYKEEHGNCDVPHSYENTELSKWVQKQRYLSTLNSRGTKTNLTDARAAKMTKLGFEWRPSNSSWDNQYRKLCEYNQLHGHCHVPRPYPEDPKLSNWVFNQRSEYSRKQRGLKNSLTFEREAKLDTLNFRWCILGKKKRASEKSTKLPTPAHFESKYVAATANQIIRRVQYGHQIHAHYIYKQRQQQAAAIAHQEQLIVSGLLRLKG